MALEYGYFEPRELASVVKQIPPVPSFLKDRYFPTSKNFMTERVPVEYKDGTNKLAPFVAPRKKGVVDFRSGYEAKEYEPANIAPERVITPDDLNRKLLGEAVYSNMSPAERAINLLKEDMVDLDEQITRREEWMAAQTMLTNGCIMKHIVDEGTDKYMEMEIRFYDQEHNPATYTPEKAWGKSGCDIVNDIYDMMLMLTRKGLPAKDVLVGSDVAKVMSEDEKILKLLDNRRVYFGEMNPTELSAGASILMTLNIKGRKVDVITYDPVYEADDGSAESYIPADAVIVTAPGAGRRAYGAVTMINNRKFVTLTGSRVAKNTANEEKDELTTTLFSKPIFMPIQKNPWISANVLG